MELTTTKYKQTEVGLIPEDWDLVPFDKVFTFHSTSNYSKAQMSDDDEVGCIHYGLIHAIPNTQYNLKNGIKYYVSSDQAKYDIIRDGDVIMVDASEDAEGVNKSVEVCGIGNKKYISGLHTYLLRDKNGSLADNFRGILLNSQLVKNQMLQLAVGMKVFGVSKTQLIKVKLPLPPTLTEQKTIAQVLSDTDALIQALEKKIAKKKHIKKGVMQKLLTPTDDWIESKVVSVGQPYGGMSGKTKADFSNGNAHYVPFMNVMSNPITDTGYLDSVNINKGESQNKIIKGDLLFNGSSETPEEVGLCSAVLVQIDNLYLNSFCFGFRIFNRKQYDSLFLAYFFRSTLGRNFFYSLAQGATRYNLSKTNFLKSTLALPIYEDQVQIASIVRDIDSEIENLEQKLSKYQLAKQGMMQQLLSGKIRLV